MDDQTDALDDWEDAPLSFEETPPPPAQPRKNAPSRSSTGFSALTMHSSDDPPLDFSDSDGGASEERLQMDGDVDEDSGSDEFPALTDEEDWQSDDEELPELAFSSDEEVTLLDPTPATPGRGGSASSDDESDFVDDLDTSRHRLGRGQSPCSETGPPLLDNLHGLDVCPEPAPILQQDEEMLRVEDEPFQPKQSSARPPPRKRHKAVHSGPSLAKPAENSAMHKTLHRQDVSTPALGASRPRSPTQAEMDAFFGFAAPAIEIYPQLLNLRANDGEIAATQTVARRTVPGTFHHQHGDVGPATGPSQRSEPGPDTPPDDQNRLSGRSYYQLERVPTASDSTGKPLTAVEKSLHIRSAFERVALSVLQQIADNVLLPMHPSHTKSEEEVATTSSGVPNTEAPLEGKGVVVVLAKRGGKERVMGRTQRIKFPHKYGKGDYVRLGARELAIFLRIVQLLLEGLRLGVVSTKRDLYYRDVQLFGKQQIVDTMIDNIAATLGVRRGDLNVAATSKGLFSGALRFVTRDGGVLDGTGKGALIPQSQTIGWIELDQVRWILIVEKAAVFSALNAASLTSDRELGNGILLTGKGYPDVATRELVVRLSNALPRRRVPIFALVDCDPHGLDILSTYRFGSSALAHEAQQLVAADLRWLGVRLADVLAECHARDKLLSLKSADRLKAHTLLKRGDVPPDWKRELQQMLRLGYKAETEILSERSPAEAVSREDGRVAPRSNRGIVGFVQKQLNVALAGTV
ncbi:hypothetical protein JCM3774_001700 [Rhodotorula dairenensis]